jgi:hypothetical protein
MTGGGAIWSIVASTAAGIAAQAASAAVIDQSLDGTSDGPYRPAQWQSAPLVTLTVPGTAADPSGKVGSGIAPSSQGIVLDDGTIATPSFVDNSNLHPGTQGTPDQIYVFDAVIRTEHQQRIEATQHPVQSGANIKDHAIIMSARVVLEIGMSDAMDSFTPGQWTGDASKSVNTYQTLKSIAVARQPLTITTRLNVYTNMLLMDISAPDTAETRFGLRATVVFEELFTGTVTSQQVSGRSDLTGATNLGTKQALPVPSSITQQNQTTQTTTVPNAGVLSSNPF